MSCNEFPIDPHIPGERPGHAQIFIGARVRYGWLLLCVGLQTMFSHHFLRDFVAPLIYMQLAVALALGEMVTQFQLALALALGEVVTQFQLALVLAPGAVLLLWLLQLALMTIPPLRSAVLDTTSVIRIIFFYEYSAFQQHLPSQQPLLGMQQQFHLP